MKTNRVLNVTIAILIVAVVGLSLFAFIRPSLHTNQEEEVQSSKSLKSSKSTSKHKKSSSKRESNSSSQNSITVTSVTQSSSQNTANTPPNAGKVLKYDNVAAAESAIKQHEATCPYDHEPFYPGLVYTGTYQCKCGLKIIWWDKAVKESVNEGMQSFANEGIDDSYYNYDTSDPWPDIPTANDPSSSN
jgi:hypothetical protein